MDPILFSPQIFWGLKGYLKKQSQFANGQIGVKYYMKGYYGNMSPWRVRKNKANQACPEHRRMEPIYCII